MKKVLIGAALMVSVALPGCARRPDRVVFGIGMASNVHPGVQLAVNEINARGGIGGVRVETTGMESLRLQDEFNPVTVLKLADRFIATNDLLAVIGHSDSASTLSAAAAYNKNRVPQIVTIATNPAITNIGNWTYRLCLSDAAQGPALADYAANDWQKRRVALFFVNDDYGRDLAQAFEKRLRQHGGTIVASVMHHNALDPDDKALIRSTLETLKQESAPDLVVLFQRVDASVWTVEAIRDAGLDLDILGGDNLAQSTFSALDPHLTARVRVSQFFRLDPANSRATAFARSFKAFTGHDPDYGQAFAYDAVYLLHDAVLKSGYSREAVKRYLDRLIGDRTPVDGVAGRFILGADHDARRPLYIAQIRDKRFEIIKTVPVK